MWVGLEDDVQFAQGFVEFPVPAPAAGDEEGISGTDELGLSAVGGDGHGPGEDVHEFVGF